VRGLAVAVAALVTAGGFGCASDGIDSAAKADIDQRLSQLQPSEETFPPSESFLPMAFKPGQWTRYRVVNEKNEASIVTAKLIGQDEGSYWLEVVDETYRGREVVKLLIQMLAGRDPTGVEVRAGRVRVGKEKPVLLEGPALDQAKERYRAQLDLLALVFESDVKDDAKTPAGHFIGCYSARVDDAWGPLRAPAVLCAHPSVPLSGIVTAKAVGKPGSMELIGFGVTGADTEL
jgi:hypothetical protein